MTTARPISKRLLWTVIGTVIAVLGAVGALTNTTLRSIERDLPNRLLTELGDQALILEHLSQVSTTATIAEKLTDPEHLELLHAQVETAYGDIVRFRETFVFDNLIHSSAFHAVVAPAIADLRIWMSEGVSGFGPRSGTTISIVARRIRNAVEKARTVNRESQNRARSILEDLRERLDNFLVTVNLLFGVTIIASIGMVVLLFRQYALQQQELSAQREIHKQSELLNSLFESISLGITVWSRNAELLHMNLGFTAITGYTGKDIRVLDDWFAKAFPETDYRQQAVKDWQLSQTKKNIIRELNVACRNGEVKTIEFRGICLGDGRKVITLADITDRKKIERTLRESEEKYRLVMEGTPDPVVVYDEEGRVIYVNPAFSTVFGWTRAELQGKKIDYVPNEEWPATRKMVDRMIRGEKYQGFETRRYTKTGEIVDVRMSFDVWRDNEGNRVGSIVVLHDVTEQKKLEAQLQQALKMESIGTLAGGIAHDFNNILSAIFGYTELALDDLPPDSALRGKLEAIHSSGQRARDLVAQILSFSRKDEHLRSRVQVSHVIADALKLLRPAIPSSIEIQTTLTADDAVLGDPSRLHQVVMNLCTNAYQAMQEHGGVLQVSLTTVELNVPMAAPFQLEAGSYLKMTVADSGSGIAPENLKRIFDPYFTTKEKGKGTGLGLAAVHGIVKSHGGAIDVQSRVGEGTTFDIYLPVMQAVEDVKSEEPSRVVGGNERILVVDDEPAILAIQKEMLEKLGYTVSVCSDPREAFCSFADNPQEYDLVITDMTMPGMTGDRLTCEIRDIRATIPIILCTGYSELMTQERAETIGISALLMKPVTMNDLSRCVRAALDKADVTVQDASAGS